MWHIPIKYKDNTEDIVSPFMLDELISSDRIRQFYRPSEQRWVTLGVDQTRRTAGEYAGQERRRPICDEIAFPGDSAGSH